MNFSYLFSIVAILREENLNELTDFVFGFIHDQKTLTVLNVNMNKMDSFLAIIHESHEICVETWHINNDVSALEFNHMGKGIDTPSTITSYLVVINSVEDGFNYLVKFSKLNSVGKWIFIFKELTMETVEEFFIRAWRSYKMLNLLGILQNGTDYKFIIFNPFIPKPDGGRGIFYNFKSNEWKNASVIIKNRLRNLHGYSIKVINSGLLHFDYIPVYNSYGQFVRYKLMDGSIFTVLQTIMNFKAIFYEPSSFNDSQLTLNENITNIQNIIENDKVDISAIVYPMQRLDTNNILFLQNVDILKICYLVPKKIVGVNYLVSQFNIFDVQLQILTAVTFIVVTTFIVASIKLKSKMGKKYEPIGNSLLVLWQIINSTSVHKLKKQNNRLILSSIMFYSLIICSMYQGIIINRLIQEPRANEIDTLSDVDKSGLNIISTIPDVFKPSTPEEADENELLYRLYKKHVYKPDVTTIMLRLKVAANISVVFQLRHAQWMQSMMYDLKTGKDMYHIVKEMALYFPRSFMVPKTSPYREIMNEAILYANEFGFYNLGHEEGDFLIISGMYERAKAGFYQERTIIITIEHIWPIVVVLVLVNVMEIFVFLLEVFFYKRYN